MHIFPPIRFSGKSPAQVTTIPHVPISRCAAMIRDSYVHCPIPQYVSQRGEIWEANHTLTSQTLEQTQTAQSHPLTPPRPPKFNIDPEKWWLETSRSYWVSGTFLNFGRVQGTSGLQPRYWRNNGWMLRNRKSLCSLARSAIWQVVWQVPSNIMIMKRYQKYTTHSWYLIVTFISERSGWHSLRSAMAHRKSLFTAGGNEILAKDPLGHELAIGETMKHWRFNC